jgi:ribonuclease-3
MGQHNTDFVMTEGNLGKLEKKINYKFKNKELLKNALTHKTYAFEAKTPVEYNERLEFLGDSILGFIIAEQLYRSNKYFSEGELTRRRAQLVNNVFLAEKAQEIDLGQFLMLGRGESLQNGAENPTNLANALEALVGAVYLDSDLETARKFIMNNLFEAKYQF